MQYAIFSRPVRKLNSEALGLDVHKRTIVYCRLDRRGQVVAEGSIPASAAALDRLLDEQIGRRQSHVTLEASGCFLWVFDRLVERLGASRTHVAQARRIRPIAESKYKTDRTDAFWLAYFTHEGRLPEAWVPDGARRELRLAARLRHRAVCEQTACVNEIRGDLAQLGHTIPGAGLHAPEALAQAWEIARQTEGMRGLGLQEGLERLVAIRARIARWDERLDELTAALPEVRALVETIPGLGRVLAALVVAESGDLQRFASAKAYAAYTGLTPGYRISAGKGVPRAISREGSSLLRYALTQAVMACTRARHGPAFVVGEWVRRQEKRMGAKGRARCAAARKLAETVWRFFHYGECFNAARAFGGKRRSAA